ncbi:MAG: cobalt-precorrin-5B (C(1))-methyltransferase CbiD [Lachnospiraceae bacterium]
MSGIIYGIGVGPGDPGLITMKAAELLRSCDKIGIPAKDEKVCTAYQIALQAIPEIADKPVIAVPIPMTTERERLEKAYERGCMLLLEALDDNQTVAFLNLGDPTLYGTYMELHQRIRHAGYQALIVSGVPSFCAVAAQLEIALASGRETIHIVPGCYDVSQNVNPAGTTILMKSGSKVGEVKQQLMALEDREQLKAYAVTNCGMENQQSYQDIKCLQENAGYFTTIIMKAQKEAKPYLMKYQQKLRCGITTGTCAAAAATAAADLLLRGIRREQVVIQTPKGVSVTVPVQLLLETQDMVTYRVIKDSGDDPDVTNHTAIEVSVEKKSEVSQIGKAAFSEAAYPNLYLDGGTGIGRISLDGLEQEMGQAAINIIPRRMIFQAVGEICLAEQYTGNLLILVSIPEGEALAHRTFNPRLGIVGGLSILGTGGILEPMSERAILATIETQIRQMQVQGNHKLIVTPGNYGQSYASQSLHLNMERSIQCSNYIGDTLDLAIAYGMQQFLLIGNIGKLVKLAAGIMNTHSKVADGRCEILAVHTVLCGGSQKMAETIMQCINTEEILRHLEEWGLRDAVIDAVCRKIQEHINRRVGDKMQVGVILFSEKFGYLGQTEQTNLILAEYR